MKVLITGATGFIGSAVARRVQREGADLRLLVRPGANRRNLAGLDAEVVAGDLNDRAALARACRSCQGLFHVAADYRLWAPDPAEIYRGNVQGTRNILQAAAAAGISRVVYTSSVGVLGLPADGSPGTEDTPVALADMVGHYKRSKFIAETVVTQFVRDGFPVVTVNPSAPIGPRDIKPTPTGRIVLEAAAGRMPAYVQTGLNVVHVDDVADGHWRAFMYGDVGQRYILGGSDMTLREILTEIAGLMGRRPPRLQLPHRLILPIAYAAEAIARLTGKAPVTTVEGVKLSRKMMFFSSAKAQRELGYRSRPAALALADAVTWYQTNGYLGNPPLPDRRRIPV